jgi:hypothetical protein
MGALPAYEPRRVAILFHDHSRHWSRAWLKPGFRHVEVAIEVGPDWWMGVAGKLGHLLEVTPIGAFDPEAFGRAVGAEVLVLEAHVPEPRRWPLSVLTCVGVAKAALGIRAPWALTPWRLYRRLTNR